MMFFICSIFVCVRLSTENKKTDYHNVLTLIGPTKNQKQQENLQKPIITSDFDESKNGSIKPMSFYSERTFYSNQGSDLGIITYPEVSVDQKDKPNSFYHNKPSSSNQSKNLDILAKVESGILKEKRKSLKRKHSDLSSKIINPLPNQIFSKTTLNFSKKSPILSKLLHDESSNYTNKPNSSNNFNPQKHNLKSIDAVTKKNEPNTTLIENPKLGDIRQIFDCFDSNSDDSKNCLTLYSSTKSEIDVISTHSISDQTKTTSNSILNINNGTNRNYHHFILENCPKGDSKSLVLVEEKSLSSDTFKKPQINLRTKTLQARSFLSGFREYKTIQCLCKINKSKCKHENYKTMDDICIKYPKTQYLYDLFLNDQELLQKLLNKQIQNLFCLTIDEQKILFIKFMLIFNEIYKNEKNEYLFPVGIESLLYEVSDKNREIKFQPVKTCLKNFYDKKIRNENGQIMTKILDLVIDPKLYF
ncbi:hypothetical protein GVAV_002446 [Gurleya vavrai]